MRVVLPLLVLAVALVAALSLLGSGGTGGVEPTRAALTPATFRHAPADPIDVLPEEQAPTPPPAAAAIEEPVGEASRAAAEERTGRRSAASGKSSPSAILQGSVLDAAGIPLAGVRVLIADRRLRTELPLDCAAVSESERSDLVVEVSTNDAGHFTARGLRPGPIHVALRAPGFAALDFTNLVLAPRGTTVLAPFELPLGAIVRGVVLDEDERPVSGAEYFFTPGVDPDPALGAATAVHAGTTGEDGRLVVNTLPVGAWTLLVRAREVPEHRFEGASNEAGRAGEDYAFRLQVPNSIAGRVVSANRGIDLSGLVVRAVPIGELENVAHAKNLEGHPAKLARGFLEAAVGPTGEFRLEPTWPRTSYALRAQHADHAFRVDDAWSIPTVADAGAEDVELTWQPAASVTFRVLDSLTTEPVRNFEVALAGATPSHIPARDWPGGTVALEGVRLLPGYDSIVVRIRATGYRDFESRTYELRPGRDLDVDRIFLRPRDTLSIRVKDAETERTLTGAEARLVEAPILPPPYDESSGDTDGKGRLVLNDFPSKPRFLGVRAEGYAPVLVQSPFQLEDGELVVSMTRGATARVEVRSSDGEPVVGLVLRHLMEDDDFAWVFGRAGGSVADAYTDSSGIALFPNLAAGQHVFSLDRPLESLELSEWTQARLREGDERELTLGVDAFAELSGRIELDGDPLIGAKLRIGGALTRTDDRGRYRFRSVEAGKVLLSIEHVALAMDHVSVLELEAGENQRDLNLVLATVRGRVRDAAGKSIADVPIFLHERRWRNSIDLDEVKGRNLFALIDRDTPRPVAYSDGNGEFEIRGVPEALGLTVSARGPEGELASERVLGTESGKTLFGVELTLRAGARLDLLPLKKPFASGQVALVAAFDGTNQIGAELQLVHPYRGQGVSLTGLAPGHWKLWVVDLSSFGEVNVADALERLRLGPGEWREHSLE